MSDVITNMKVRFSADTKQFKKGMDEGKQATQQFKNDAGSALEDFASAFGVNIGAINSGIGKANTALKTMGAGFKAAGAASGILSKAMQVLKVALISTGIGALVVALGSLVAYFTKTERGAERFQRVMAGIKAVFGVLIDRLALFGEGIFKIFTGDFKGAWDTLKESVKGIGAEMVNESKAAVDLERRLQELEDREIALIEVQSERNKKIDEAKFLAEKEGISLAQKQKALKEAAALERQTLAENLAMQRERVAIMQEQFNMGSKTDDQLRDLNNAKAELNNLEGESLKIQRKLEVSINSVTREMAAQTEEIKKQQAELKAARDEAALGPDGEPLKKMKTIGLQGLDLKAPELEVDKLAANLKAGLEPAKDVIIDFSEVFSSAIEDIATSFGESMGALISGTGSFSDFGNELLSTLGSLLVKIGKMIMTAGLAFFQLGMAFQTAITNPATALLAVAAGAALIAVGSAVKSSISSAASGGGGTFSSNASGGGAVFDTRTAMAKSLAPSGAQELKIKLYGEFRQRGSDMIATINESSKRSAYHYNGR